MKKILLGFFLFSSIGAHADCDITAINLRISTWLKKPFPAVKTVDGKEMKGTFYASEIYTGTGLVKLNTQYVASTVFEAKYVWDNGTTDQSLETQLTPIDPLTCETQIGTVGVKLIAQP